MGTLKNQKIKVMVLRLDRDIDVGDMEKICGIIDRYRAKGYAFSILDLGAVNHVNFLGLKQLSQTAGRQKDAGGGLALSGMSGYLKNIFQIVGVYSDFKYFSNSSRGIHAIQKERLAKELDVAVIQGKNLKGIY
jgi:anti-anti-sigma regulatory factor